jgi:hypothetical protein
MRGNAVNSNGDSIHTSLNFKGYLLTSDLLAVA